MSYQDLYASMREHIKTTGRSCLTVLDTPPFTYSIGNHLKNLPELLVVGLAPQDAKLLINGWSALMIERGREFADGELVNIGGDFPCKAVSCRPQVRATYTIQAGQYLGHEDYRVTQMLVPDRAGRFPNDPGCAEPYCRVPVLGLN